MRTHCGGFPVSGSQGMGNREAASNSLIPISLTLPREVASARMPGKPICQRSARGSGGVGKNRGVDSRPTLSWYEGTVLIADRQAAHLSAGNDEAGVAVAI